MELKSGLGACRAERLVQNVENCLFAGVERLIVLVLLLESDHHVILRADVLTCR